MKNLILSTTPVDLTNIIPGVNYAATTSAVTYNKTPVVFGNKINYTTSGNTVMTFDTIKMFGSTDNQLNILSNVYENGLGTTTFDDKIITVSSALCSGNTDITSITVPGRINNLNCNNIFEGCYNLSGVSLNTSNVSNMSIMFRSCYNLSGVSLNTSNVTNMSGMFNMCYNLSGVSLNTSNVSNMSYMFSSCSKLSGVTLDTSNVTNMSNMFTNCTNLSGVNLSNTSNVTNMSNMFANCTNLSGVNLSNTSNVTNMSGMFGYCSNLSGVSLNTSNVTDMSGMFYFCSNLSGVSLNTSNVTSMNYMFYSCTKLSSISLDVSSVINMTIMLNYCRNLKNIEMTNFGKASGLTGSVDFSSTIWGSGTTAEEIAVNTQSIRDTLITNSYDRAIASYSVLTITLSTYTKALLTDAEKAQITAKGYTIA